MKRVRFLSWILCFSFLCLSFLSLRAAIPEDAVYKRKRLTTDYYLSPRALGRGNTYVTTSDQEDALFLNPALLYSEDSHYGGTFLFDPTFVGSMRTLKTVKEFGDISSILQPENLEKDSELSGTYKAILEVLDDWEEQATSLYSSLFLGSFFKYVGFGVLTSATLDLDSGYTTVNSPGESVRVNSLITVAPSVGVSGPMPFLEGLQVGVAVHYLIRFEIDIDQGKDLYDLLALREDQEKFKTKDFMAFGHKPAFDFGIVYKPKIFLNPRFGLSARNIGHVKFKDLDGRIKYEMEPVRQDLALGASIHPELGPGVLSVSLDFRNLTRSYDRSFLSETYLGIDYLLWETMGFSTGLSQGYPSFGFYVTSRFVQVDIGFNTRERELRVGTKPDPRFYFKFRVSL